MAFNFNDYRMREEPHKDIRYFESKFEALIEDSKEYKQYVRQVPYNFTYGKLSYEDDLRVVPMKSIHLTTDSLERLIREQERMDHLEKHAKYGKELWTMLRADERVRDDNPAVAKAYRNYLALLELARK
jgi:hypothetical protein